MMSRGDGLTVVPHRHLSRARCKEEVKSARRGEGRSSRLPAPRSPSLALLPLTLLCSFVLASAPLLPDILPPPPVSSSSRNNLSPSPPSLVPPPSPPPPALFVPSPGTHVGHDLLQHRLSFCEPFTVLLAPSIPSSRLLQFRSQLLDLAASW